MAEEFGGNRDAIRKTLERLWRSGLIQFEERTKQAGKGTTKYKVYLVAEFVQRLESPQSNGLGAGQPITEALDKVDVSSAKIEPVQRLESPPSKDLSALDKSDSGIDPTSKTDSQQNIFPSLTAPQS